VLRRAATAVANTKALPSTVEAPSSHSVNCLALSRIFSGQERHDDASRYILLRTHLVVLRPSLDPRSQSAGARPDADAEGTFTEEG